MALFADFNVPWTNCSDEVDDRIRRAIEYGYDVVVINNFIPELSVKTGKKDQSKIEEIPTPDRILEEARKVPQSRPVTFYTRFSTVLSNSAQVIRLQKDPVIQSHDFISVQPTTEKLFLSACKDLEIDIISLDFTGWLPFPMKHTAVGCAIKRGVHFEIVYSPMLRNANVIKNMIYNTLQLLDSSRAKNIIVSSGCEKNFELRAPYSVISLATVFGLTEVQAKAAISLNCRAVLMHAAARKSAKGVLSIQRASQLTPGDRWKIPTGPAAEQEPGPAEREDDASSTDAVPAKTVKLDVTGEPAT